MGKLFKDILGQKSAVKILTAQLEGNKVSHAYLILGDAGVGKKYLGKFFSKYLLCPKSLEDDCASCLNFDKGVHPDFIWIDGEEGIKIEQIRDSVEKINLTPSVGKRKVLLVTKAENMGIEAANALLKTLEEPPLDSVLILTAVSEKAIPETIVSRCQKIKLSAVSSEELRELLSKEIGEKELSTIINYSEGNIGEAKRLVGDKKELDKKRDYYEDVEILLNSPSVIEKFKIIEKHDKSKSLKAFFDLFAYIISRALVAKAKGEQPQIISLSEAYNVSRLRSLALKVLNIYPNLGYNVNLKIALEELVLENSKEY